MSNGILAKKHAVCLHSDKIITSRLTALLAIKLYWHLTLTRPELLKIHPMEWAHKDGRGNVLVGMYDEVEAAKEALE